MSATPPEEVADHLHALFLIAYGGRKSGMFRISRENFRAFTRRDRLEAVIVRRVAAALLKNHGLILVQGAEYLGVMQERQLLRWREVPRGVLNRQGRKVVTPLAPEAAWPFPPGSEP